MNELLGTMLGGFLLSEEIGKGSVATIFKAHQPSQARYVALKVYHPHFARDGAIAGRFLTEAASLAQLNHPNVLPIYDFGIEDGRAFLAMELVADGTLKGKLGKPLDLDRAALILSQLAAALDFAATHGILHRNLKPGNVFLRGDDALLADFAICMDVEGIQSFTKSGVPLPSPEYTSPELAEGYRVDRRSDIYSLGIVLYQMVTGELPFVAHTPFGVLNKQLNGVPDLPGNIDPTLPMDVDEVVLKALSKSPRERYSSAEEMALAFQRSIKGGRVAVVPYPSLAGDSATAEPLIPAPAMAAELLPKAILVCPACGALQGEERRYCARCWIPLVSEDAIKPAPKLFSWRWLSDWARFNKLHVAVIAIVLVALIWVAPGALSAARARELPPLASRVSIMAGPDDWPLARGNSGQTGYVASVPRAPKGNLKWVYPIGTPADSSPVVAAGKVFVGSAPAKVYALDAETGELKWAYSTTGPVDGAPTVAGKLVYVGLRDKRILALDVETGEKKWEFKTDNPNYGSVNVVDGVVYAGSADYSLYALDAVTGAKRWQYQTGGWIASSPAVADGMVAVGSRDGYLHVLDAATGERRFQYQIGRPLEVAPAFAGGFIYIGADDGRMRAIDPRAKVSRFERLRYVWVLFYIWGFPVSAPTPPPGFTWSYRVKDAVSSSPTLAQGKVYFGGSDGSVHALWALDGTRVWEFKTGKRVSSSPVIGGETIYFGSGDGKLYALEASSGARVWDFQTKGSITAAPALAGGVIYINSNDGNLYAIE